jgi:hypothetical protein
MCCKKCLPKRQKLHIRLLGLLLRVASIHELLQQAIA